LVHARASKSVPRGLSFFFLKLCFARWDYVAQLFQAVFAAIFLILLSFLPNGINTGIGLLCVNCFSNYCDSEMFLEKNSDHFF
jgi:hypothetical protein